MPTCPTAASRSPVGSPVPGWLVAAAFLLPLTDHTRRTFCVPGGGRSGFDGSACSYVVDELTLAFQAVVLLGALVVVLLSLDTVRDSRLPAGEYYFLLLMSVAGAVTLAASRDVLTLVVSLEVVSLPAFALVALPRYDGRASEAALKLFLVSVVSTAVMLFGLSLVYGVTGHRASRPHRDGARRSRRAQRRAAARCRDLDRRVRLQGGGGAVPLLGAGHLRRRSGARGGLPFGGVEGRRLRRSRAAAHDRLCAVRRRLGTRRRGACCLDDDRRQPGRVAAAAGRALACVVVDRAVGLHAGAARCGREGRHRGRAARDGGLRAGLRGHEPRRVRGGDPGRAPAAREPARRLSRTRSHGSRSSRSRWRSPWPASPDCRPGCWACSPRSWSSRRRSSRGPAGSRS